MNPASILRLSLALVSLCGSMHSSAQSPAQVLTLPEIRVVSFRGTLNTGKALLTPPPPGQPHVLTPGMRIDLGGAPASHAVVLLPGIGGCIITEGSSLRLPAATEKDMTVTFDRHISGTPNRLLLNIDAKAMAQRGGAVFRTKNKFTGNSSTVQNPNLVFTTTGGRFFILDQQTVYVANSNEGLRACTVGVFDGSATVEEIVTKQQLQLKAGQVVRITTEGIEKPRASTKAELAYDLGCKLAVLGREVPARLPPTMKTTASASKPGSKVNTLGMVFVPVPGTKVMMCVHETRYQDFLPYLATLPPETAGDTRGVYAHGMWGWEDHPATCTWDVAQAFCAWLSQKEGKKYRLPTDEEWSYAVGLGGSEKRKADTTPEELGNIGSNEYSWGRDWPAPPGSANIADISCYAENPSYDDPHSLYDDGFAETAPVMSFKPSKLGLYDMTGNVHEWCSDWSNAARDRRVARGGGYRNYAKLGLQTSYRMSLPPNQPSFTGFRVVLEVP